VRRRNLLQTFAMLPAVSEAAVMALLDKYREIKRLRVEHARGDEQDPRPQLRVLAARFPGALRELDELPMDAIEARLALLNDVLARVQPAPSWIALQLGYHGWMRAALRIKLIARGRDSAHVDAVLAELPQRYAPSAFDPPLASLDRAAVSAILEPLDGRLNPWVFARVAAAAGVEPDAVRRALFMR
jgi:hypothetical protein